MIIDQFIYTFSKENEGKSSFSQETTLRSIVKSASWRIIGTLDTIAISYFLTGEISTAFAIGGVELFTKMVLYIIHERVWNRIKFGKRP